MVTAEITRWPTATRPALGRIVEVLGPLDAPGVDTTVIIRKYNLARRAQRRGHRRGQAAWRHGARAGSARRARTFARGRRSRSTASTRAISTTRISIDRLPNGNFWLGVHIADVAHYVAEGSALDREAYERGTSVYFPERAVHMFPSELATGLCSLQPARRSARAVVPDGSGPAIGGGRALRNARRRHPQRRADDLHRRERASSPIATPR